MSNQDRMESIGEAMRAIGDRATFDNTAIANQIARWLSQIDEIRRAA